MNVSKFANNDYEAQHKLSKLKLVKNLIEKKTYYENFQHKL